ncbi:IS30 family transposase [Salinibacterium sp. ZJ454]|uniref:IS30 family transposase n=1 Tax=Salinibacterium sp. ZJ454 TaxID=2708339 RepID=UPI00142215F3|nr:IS30 family transposase [Salinibacterium sp. ZJ454]
MHLGSSSAAGVRFLASVRDGHGLKPSARHAGIDKEVGYRWLREKYLQLRREGNTPAETTAQLGFTSSRLLAWEADVGRVTDRHHLRVGVAEEAEFWLAFDRGDSLKLAAHAARVARSTAYRWIQKRFDRLRQSGVTIRRCQAQLRLTDRSTRSFEAQRLARRRTAQNAATAAQHAAVLSSGRYADQLLAAVPSEAQQRRAKRTDTYWQLMRDGVSNAEACRLLGMSRRAGTQLRQASNFQIPPLNKRAETSGRYLDARERLQIADLLRLGHSMRRIAAELGRHPSTISRELRRHRHSEGLYLPRTADHDARLQRARPKIHKLANPRLRTLVQRKLNRFWSPDEISGWMRKTYPDDPTMRLSPETIYRALLLREHGGLHKRYASKLRTGRRIRKTRWRTRTGQGSRIRNMTMIDQRPAEVETRLEAGHWEGDLIVGVGSVSAMMTLRERKTQYGIIVNLPLDHTAASVNAAATAAFATLPPHLKRTLTWDQGVEMASHEELTKATGVPVYFAERSSPWQRGANENFNGLARQYFPKGTNLALHSAKHVARVQRELNERPRKNLDYDTPAARLKAEHNTPISALR